MLRRTCAAAGLAALAAAAVLSAPRAVAAHNVTLWDTGAPLADLLKLEDRAGWQAVPNDLLALEANPPKARSDPGYYGREYTFKGDAVVENGQLTAVFCSAQGRVVISAQAGAAAANGAAPPQPAPGRPAVEIVPLPAKGQTGRTSHCTIVRNAGDEVVLEVSFAARGAPDSSCVFGFDKTGIVEIKLGDKTPGINLAVPLAYGVVPGFVGDDLVYNPAGYPSAGALALPCENLFVGLLPGEASELVLTWPKGKQQMTLNLGAAQPGERLGAASEAKEPPEGGTANAGGTPSAAPAGQRLIASVDFHNDGQPLYLALLSAPGLWHKEPLTSAFLEKDVTLRWQRPFPARWKTQLAESGVRTSFAFRETKGQIWRGVTGEMVYPAWFEGERARLHLSKKVAPQGEALIYCLEGADTPPGILTPADILTATLGRAGAGPVLDLAGRKLRTHHRRGGDGVRRACTCGCTEAIQAVFEAGQETAQKDYIAGAVDDMLYFVHRHVERIAEYKRLADDLTTFLRGKGSAAPELKPYADGLEAIAQKIPQGCEVQKDNMKSFAYADDLKQQTMALAGRKDPGNLKAYMKLLTAWRGMGGSQDSVLAMCHMVARQLCQEAGYACATQPQAVGLAEEIRARCRQCLRNADGYEIWADY